jgi:hypothetical protein
MDLSEFFDNDDRPYLTCSVAWAMQSFNETQTEKAQAVLALPQVPSKRIAEVFNTWNPARPVSTATVTRHRRKECRCD